MMDAVTVIMDDHRLLERLSTRLRTDRRHRGKVLAELAARLEAHNVAEETYVYPALVRYSPDEIHHGVAEHRAASRLLTRVATADDADFEDSAEDFVTALLSHIAEEEDELLPALREAVSPRRLRELGQDFETRRVGALDRVGLEWTVTAL